MQIEFKNTDFKRLHEWLNPLAEQCKCPNDIQNIILKTLKPQYEKAFLKYQNEKQEFNVGDKVKFHWPNDKNWWDGTIYKVSRLASGQYKYIIKYLEHADDCHYDLNRIENGMGVSYTNPMTKKNIKKI